MQKKLVMALTSAIVAGATATTFAAANPFSDVPTDHWAYDAVSQLAADGVIDGYGDSTFQGNKNITRYEMAQMIARAMAKKNVAPASDKALIDKLSAEFSDELNNLGVRVANLERNADKVAWHGTAEYTFQHYMVDGENDHKKNQDSYNNLLLRFVPDAEVNQNWHVKARIDANTSLDTDEGKNANGDEIDKLQLKRIWAEGHYGANRIMLGKFEMPDPDTITDTPFSGAEYSYQPAGDGVSFVVGAGRFSAASNESGIMGTAKENGSTDTANVQYVGVGFQKSKLNGAARYYHADTDYFNTTSSIAYAKSKEDTANIWEVKGGYRFDKNWGFKGFYSQNTEADYFDKAGSAEIDYKGAQAENAGTFGLWVAYRHLSRNAVLASPFDVINTWNSVGQKGWEIGGNYAMFQNTILTLRYGDGEELAGGKDVKNLFGRVNFLF